MDTYKEKEIISNAKYNFTTLPSNCNFNFYDTIFYSPQLSNRLFYLNILQSKYILNPHPAKYLFR